MSEKNKIKRNPAKTPYQKKPYKSLDKQFQVTVYAMAGLSQREIAKLTKINRETVSRILSQTEIGMKRAEGRSILINAIPALSLQILAHARGVKTAKDPQTILELLRGIQVLTHKAEVEDTTVPEERNYALPAVMFYEKYGRWPTLKQAIKFDKTIEVQRVFEQGEKALLVTEP